MKLLISFKYAAFCGFIVVFLAGCGVSGTSDLSSANPFIKEISPRTYDQILESDIEPALSPDFKFPISYQFQNGCFAFAVKHVMEYKYDKTIDLLEAEKKIEKPRSVLWDAGYVKDFLDEYDIEMNWYRDSETFFRFLQEGEPLVIQYPYEVPGNKYIGHLVAAYSFDKEGVWVSDSISGNWIRINWDEVFGNSKKYTIYGFATVHDIITE